jgi:Xaa-Pro aminopeptidase
LETAFVLAVAASATQAHPLPSRLSPEFHKNRLEEIYRRCPDGLILLRGELDWFRKRELRAFDPSFHEPNFRQEKTLYYLTGIEVPDSFVLIDPRKREVHLYTDWKGERELIEVKKQGLVSAIHPAAAFLRDARIRAADYDTLYTLYVPFVEDGTLFGKTGVMTGIFPAGMGEPVTEESQFARRLAELFPGLRIKSLHPVVSDMQKIKQSEEIRLIREANAVSVKGVREAMKAVRPGLYDHDISAVIEYTFLRNGAAGPTFANNLMSGPHMFMKLVELWADYSHLDRELKSGDGIFIDIGAEIGYYQSDIGRTAPVSGRFTPEQRKLYDIYLICYLEALHSVRPGITQRDLVNICARAMDRQLPSLKEPYLRKAAAQFIKDIDAHPALGHYEDMNVIGAGADNDEPLRPGMVFAIEPVLYVPDMSFAVFIEDVVLVTENGYEVLSKGLPYTPDEVEAVMAERSIIETLGSK